ncbi:MAG: leuA, partial [Caulobacteraceae bacterium]|nr:leuA [Caulobacteraceae bacterium]
DFSDMETVVKTVEYCNQLPVHPRHPYAGELVFTAFSGSHQDAIKKGFDAQAKRNDQFWNVPYLPIDPADLGGAYEAVIRVNSQSGKGGVAWVLQQDKGLRLPKPLQADFSRIVQQLADETSRELTTVDIWAAFERAYHLTPGGPFELIGFEETGSSRADQQRVFVGELRLDGKPVTIRGRGNGLISSLLAALDAGCGLRLDVADFQEHAVGAGAEAQAAAYVQCRTADGRILFGVGLDADVATASVRAVLSAANTAVASG